MSPIDRALRNKRILEWYRSIPLIAGPGVVTRSRIVVEYARHLQCPVCEVTPEMLEPEDLDFIYTNYMKLIEKA